MAMRVWAFGGGKGGVGKSLVCAVVGAELARRGLRVVAVDADLGAANLHTLLGVLQPARTLDDFVRDPEARLEDVCLETEVANLRLVSGAAAILRAAHPRPAERDRLVEALLHLDADVVLLDLGAGTHYATLDLFNLAGTGLVVTGPEPTSIQNAYAFLKAALFRRIELGAGHLPSVRAGLARVVRPRDAEERLDAVGALIEALRAGDAEAGEAVAALVADQRARLVVNQGTAREERRVLGALRVVCQRYLDIDLAHAGTLPVDAEVRTAIRRMKSVARAAPVGPLADAVRPLVDDVLGADRPPRPELLARTDPLPSLVAVPAETEAEGSVPTRGPVDAASAEREIPARVDADAAAPDVLGQAAEADEARTDEVVEPVPTVEPGEGSLVDEARADEVVETALTVEPGEGSSVDEPWAEEAAEPVPSDVPREALGHEEAGADEAAEPGLSDAEGAARGDDAAWADEDAAAALPHAADEAPRAAEAALGDQDAEPSAGASALEAVVASPDEADDSWADWATVESRVPAADEGDAEAETAADEGDAEAGTDADDGAATPGEATSPAPGQREPSDARASAEGAPEADAADAWAAGGAEVAEHREASGAGEPAAGTRSAGASPDVALWDEVFPPTGDAPGGLDDMLALDAVPGADELGELPLPELEELGDLPVGPEGGGAAPRPSAKRTVDRMDAAELALREGAGTAAGGRARPWGDGAERVGGPSSPRAGSPADEATPRDVGPAEDQRPDDDVAAHGPAAPADSVDIPTAPPQGDAARAGAPTDDEAAWADALDAAFAESEEWDAAAFSATDAVDTTGPPRADDDAAGEVADAIPQERADDGGAGDAHDTGPVGHAASSVAEPSAAVTPAEPPHTPEGPAQGARPAASGEAGGDAAGGASDHGSPPPPAPHVDAASVAASLEAATLAAPIPAWPGDGPLGGGALSAVTGATDDAEPFWPEAEQTTGSSEAGTFGPYDSLPDFDPSSLDPVGGESLGEETPAPAPPGPRSAGRSLPGVAPFERPRTVDEDVEQAFDGLVDMAPAGPERPAVDPAAPAPVSRADEPAAPAPPARRHVADPPPAAAPALGPRDVVPAPSPGASSLPGIPAAWVEGMGDGVEDDDSDAYDPWDDVELASSAGAAGPPRAGALQADPLATWPPAEPERRAAGRRAGAPLPDPPSHPSTGIDEGVTTPDGSLHVQTVDLAPSQAFIRQSIFRDGRLVHRVDHPYEDLLDPKGTALDPQRVPARVESLHRQVVDVTRRAGLEGLAQLPATEGDR